MNAHVFVDNSNVYGGAQRASVTLEPEAVWMAVRVYYRNLFGLIEQGFSPVTRVIAGSVPPGNKALWDHARAAGYNTDLLNKIKTEDARLVEQGVDEVVHLKIANALLDHTAPQTLILCTGDGHESDFGTSFTKQIERALTHGWDVIIWSWKEQLSGKFARLTVPHGRSLVIKDFDSFYKKITFVKDGKYDIKGSMVDLRGRVVHPL